MKLTFFVHYSLLVVCLSSCTGLFPSPTEIETPASTETPTSTISWFPPTNTPTEFPKQTAVPTNTDLSGVGDLVFSDSFSQSELWNTSSSDWASALITRNRLVLSISGQGPLSISSIRSEPLLLDFYVEATATINLCSGRDQYGLIFRAGPSGYYRLTLNCEGQVRLDRGKSGTTSPQTDWLASGDVPSGPPAEVTIGVWAQGREMRFYLNNHYQFTSPDPLVQSGRVGFFIYSSTTSPITVSYSDLSVYSVVIPSATPSATSSTTPNP